MNSRHRLNIILNLVISSLILILGISSIIVSAYVKAPENFLFEFRYMTVNGTVFTSIIAFMILIVSIIEAKSGKYSIADRLYYFRLSSAITESIIAVVIAMSFFPAVPDSPNILSYESFNMHVIIPILSIVSFLLNRSPRETMHPLLRLNCAWLITIYASIVITLILTGTMPQDKIPYSFLDFRTRSIWYIVYFGFFIYSFTYVLSYIFTNLNKRMSSFWNPNDKKPVSSN